jgi:hypothetical protein
MKKIFLAASLLVAGHAFSGGSTGGFPGVIAEELTLGKTEFEKLAVDAITNESFVYKGRLLKPDMIRLNDQVKAMSFRSVEKPDEIILIQQGAYEGGTAGGSPGVMGGAVGGNPGVE